MRKTKLITALVATMLAVLPFSASAENGEQNLSNWKFKETIIGEKPTAQYLKGKVVVIEYWGVN